MNLTNSKIKIIHLMQFIAKPLLVIILSLLFFYIGAFLSAWKFHPFSASFQDSAIIFKERIRVAREYYYSDGLYAALNHAYNDISADFLHSKNENALTLFTGLHEITLKKYNYQDVLQDYFKFANRAPGYFDFFNDDYALLVTGDGRLIVINTKNMDRSFIESNLADLLKSQNYELQGFGIRGLFFDKLTSAFYVSYYSKGKNGCYSLAIAKSNKMIGNLTNANINILFTNFYTHKICSINAAKNMWASGGRIVRVNNDTLALSVGSYSSNNLDIPKRDLSSESYGSVVYISNNGLSLITAVGLRNPQGMDFFNGNLVVSDSGPKGGDEINFIRNGADYGWPLASYGLDYANGDVYKRSHAPNFEEPLFYFPPTFATSEIRFYNHSNLFRWKNSLLVSSLIGKSIMRLQYDNVNRRFISSEPIKIGYRIRDLKISDEGIVWILSDEGYLISLSRSFSE
jgi:glucose/arabinose dehydrogenase